MNLFLVFSLPKGKQILMILYLIHTVTAFLNVSLLCLNLLIQIMIALEQMIFITI